MDKKKLKWKLFKMKEKALLIYGLKTGRIQPYSEELLDKLRNIYYGGIPASIILLSNGLSNGYCYDRALLLSQAFLGENDRVRLVYGDVDSIKLNPNYQYDEKDKLAFDHCVVETIENGKHYIYDTSSGFVYDKDYYLLMEHPKIRRTVSKRQIIDFIAQEDQYSGPDPYVANMVLPMIEKTYGRENEMYSIDGINMLQREIAIYKDKIESLFEDEVDLKQTK